MRHICAEGGRESGPLATTADGNTPPGPRKERRIDHGRPSDSPTTPPPHPSPVGRALATPQSHRKYSARSSTTLSLMLRANPTRPRVESAARPARNGAAPGNTSASVGVVPLVGGGGASCAAVGVAFGAEPSVGVGASATVRCPRAATMCCTATVCKPIVHRQFPRRRGCRSSRGGSPLCPPRGPPGGRCPRRRAGGRAPPGPSRVVGGKRVCPLRDDAVGRSAEGEVGFEVQS